MYVEKASLGNAGSWIPEVCIPAVEGWDGVNDEASKDRIDSFLAIPAEERSWALAFAPHAPVFIEPLAVEPISAVSASGQVITRRRGGAALSRQRLLRQAGQPIVIKQEVLPPSSRTRSNTPAPVPRPMNLPSETVLSINSDTPEESPAKRKRDDSVSSQAVKIKISLDAEKTAASIYSEHAGDLGPVAQSMDGGLLKDQHACNLFNAYTSGLTLGYKYQDTCAALADSQARLRLAKAEVQGLECRLAQMTKDLEAARKDIQRLPNLEAALDESKLLHGKALSEIDQLSAKVREMETNEDGLGLYYGSMARIELLRLPPGSVSLESEIAEFRHLFPDCVVPGEEAEVGEGSVVQMAVDAGDIASGSGLAPPPSVDGSAIPDVLEQTSAVVDEV